MTLERSQLTAGNMIRSMVRTLGDVFAPIIPAIVASGLLMGLTEGIDNAMGNALQMNSWWILIHNFSNASFVFLQILIGFSAARVFGGNEFLGGVIGMVMNHTSLMNAWSIPEAIHRFGRNAYQIVGTYRAASWISVVTGTETTAAGASSQAIMNAGGIPQVDLIPQKLEVTLQGYQGHVLAVVFAVFVMCKLEQWLHAHVPDMLDLFVTPLATVLLTSLVVMIVIGPAFTQLETFTMSFFQFLFSIPFGVGTALAGALYPLTVVLGVHHLFAAYEASLCALTPPYNQFNPIVSAACVAHAGACLAIFFKTASVRRKGISLPASIAALLGVTEPAIYGINLALVRPFVAAIVGSTVGGALVYVLDVYATSSGVVGIFGYLIAADSGAYATVLAAAFAVAFGTALLLYQEAPQVEEAPAELEQEAVVEDAAKEPEAAAETPETVEETQPAVDEAEAETEAEVSDVDDTAKLPVIRSAATSARARKQRRPAYTRGNAKAVRRQPARRSKRAGRRSARRKR